ncbi:ubiquitin carboxyl-terminal hydrolase [Cunninghamella echinulata]|nr:ubiquitin carboxyl-terminal hydrolase [Cunninghamella echinulata]
MKEYEFVQKSLSPPWSLIESSPSIFNSMIRMYGAKDLDIREIFDIEEFNIIQEQAYGVIFSSVLAETPTAIEVENPEIDSMFFSSQVVVNVCATSALLGVLLNIEDNKVNIGKKLREFKKFTKGFNSVDCGLAIANSEFLKETHNTFGSLESKTTALNYPGYNDVYTGRKSKKRHVQSENNYHYTAFIPFKDDVWELDGYNKTPVNYGLKNNEGWLKNVYDVIKSRMEESDTLEFNILIVVKSQKQSIPSPTASTPTASITKSSKNIFFENLLLKSNNLLRSEYGGDETDPLTDIYIDIMNNADTLKEDEHEEYITKTFKEIELAKRKSSLLMLQSIARKGLESSAEQPKKNSVLSNIDDYDTKKFIKRNQHDYIPFINALFKKLDEHGLLKDIQ